jgi:hypothetical protein
MNDKFVYTICERKALHAIKHQCDKQFSFSQLFYNQTNNKEEIKKRLMSGICNLSIVHGRKIVQSFLTI